MTYISNNLRERGIKVLVCPEMATTFAIGGGLIDIHKMTLEQNVRFQVFILFCGVLIGFQRLALPELSWIWKTISVNSLPLAVNPLLFFAIEVLWTTRPTSALRVGKL